MSIVSALMFAAQRVNFPWTIISGEGLENMLFSVTAIWLVILLMGLNRYQRNLLTCVDTRILIRHIVTYDFSKRALQGRSPETLNREAKLSQLTIKLIQQKENIIGSLEGNSDHFLRHEHMFFKWL